MPNDAGRTKVFLSYSRRNSAFADEIKVSLESHGYEATIDREDLYPGYSWEERLLVLIREADAIAYLVSEASVHSDECNRELDIARQEGKRIIPLMIEEMNYGGLPEALRRLQFIFFIGPDKTFARGVASLIEALGTDVSWVSKHSTFSQRARSWREHGDPDASLLRGVELADSLTWMGGKAAPNMQITPLTIEFIDRSKRVAEADERASLRRRIGQVVSGSAILLLSVALLGLYLFKQSDDAANEGSASFAEFAATAPKDTTDPEAALLQKMASLEPLIDNLTSENTFLRRSTRSNIAGALNGYNDGALNQRFIARILELSEQNGQARYRLVTGAGVALSQLETPAPISDQRKAINDLSHMYCLRGNDDTSRGHLYAAIRRFAPGESAPTCGGSPG